MPKYPFKHLSLRTRSAIQGVRGTGCRIMSGMTSQSSLCVSTCATGAGCRIRACPGLDPGSGMTSQSSLCVSTCATGTGCRIGACPGLDPGSGIHACLGHGLRVEPAMTLREHCCAALWFSLIFFPGTGRQAGRRWRHRAGFPACLVAETSPDEGASGSPDRAGDHGRCCKLPR